MASGLQFSGGNAAVKRIRELCNDANVIFAQLDLANQEAYERSPSSSWRKARHRLLINNAGISATRDRRTTIDGFELTSGSATSPLRPERPVAPGPAQTSAPRVVSVSSLTHKEGIIDWDDLHMAQRYTSAAPTPDQARQPAVRPGTATPRRCCWDKAVEHRRPSRCHSHQHHQSGAQIDGALPYHGLCREPYIV